MTRYTTSERADYDLLTARGRNGYDDLRQVRNDIGHADAFFAMSLEQNFKPAVVIEMEARARLGKPSGGKWSGAGPSGQLRDFIDDQESLARIIAFTAFGNRLDKAGKPYLGHLARTVSRLRAAGYGPIGRAAGWLHDLLEDTAWTADDLRNAGVEECIVRAVILLTKVKGKSNSVYYAEVATDDIAYAVKRFGDVPDNADPRRLALLDAAMRQRLEDKYAEAIAELDADHEAQPDPILSEISR